MRGVVFSGLWGLWTALFGLAIPLLSIAGKNPRRVRQLSRVWVRGVFFLLSRIIGLNYVVRGAAFQGTDPVLIVANHQSTWETLAALVLFPDVAIVAKRELLRIPVMGWYLRNSPMIIIDREGSSQALRQMIDESRAALRVGRSVLIFPEGRRQSVGSTISFRRGVELLYKTLAVPALPLVVNSGSYWGIGTKKKRAGTIQVSLMHPIQPGLNAPEFVQVVVSVMSAELQAMETDRQR